MSSSQYGQLTLLGKEHSILQDEMIDRDFDFTCFMCPIELIRVIQQIKMKLLFLSWLQLNTFISH